MIHLKMALRQQIMCPAFLRNLKIANVCFKAVEACFDSQRCYSFQDVFRLSTGVYVV